MADTCGAVYGLGKVSVQNQAAVGLAIVQDICLEGRRPFSGPQLYEITRRLDPSEKEMQSLMQLWQRALAKG